MEDNGLEPIDLYNAIVALSQLSYPPVVSRWADVTWNPTDREVQKVIRHIMGVKDARKLAIGDEKLLSPNRISLATQDCGLSWQNHPAMTDRIVHVIDANLWWLQLLKSADSTDFAELPIVAADDE